MRLQPLLLAVVFASACTASGGSCATTSDERGFSRTPEAGTASFYSSDLQGRKTASGEKYDERQLTAAHRTLPFGSRVRVTNLQNGKSVVVRINDRGPFVRSRIIDVSRRAALELGMIRSGVVRVRVERLRR